MERCHLSWAWDQVELDQEKSAGEIIFQEMRTRCLRLLRQGRQGEFGGCCTVWRDCRGHGDSDKEKGNERDSRVEVILYLMWSQLAPGSLPTSPPPHASATKVNSLHSKCTGLSHTHTWAPAASPVWSRSSNPIFFPSSKTSSNVTPLHPLHPHHP